MPDQLSRHPLLAVCSYAEFRKIVKQVQYAEISWPQCIEQGEPIRITREGVDTDATPGDTSCNC